MFIIVTFSILSIDYNSHKIKLLFFVAAYGVKQLNLLYMQIKYFVTICESGYILRIIIHHTDILKNSSFKHFYCFEINNFIDIEFIKIVSSVNHYLVKEHRKYIIQYLNEVMEYDHIGFLENDIGFSLSNLKYYLYTLALIKENNLKNTTPGFKRFEIVKCNNGDIWRSCPDFINYVNLYIIKSKAFVRIRDGYSAMWILPRNELIKYVKEKEFVSIPDNAHKGIEGLKPYYSYSYWERHFVPIIPLERIDDCFVHHMSNKYINYSGSMQITEFYMQMNICSSKYGLRYNGLLENKIIKINRSKLSKRCVNIKLC